MSRKPLLITVWMTHRRLLIGLGSLFLLNILLFSLLYFVVAPKLSHSERELALLQQQSRRSDVVAPRQAYEQGVKDYERFRTLLPSLRNFSDLIGDLYRLAEQCNLEISQIGYTQKELPDSGLLAYALKFSLIGTYDELKRFVYGLEESKRLVVIEQMTLNAAKGEEGDALVSLSLSLTTYFGTEEGQ
ncbi:MAG: type 4a pilus biogenesis protein PilO [Desulfuromonadales bacterium]|nr:type 4a pilus biogenesis protein PilO [Desulfuromonadales bacterium]